MVSLIAGNSGRRVSSASHLIAGATSTGICGCDSTTSASVMASTSLYRVSLRLILLSPIMACARFAAAKVASASVRVVVFLVLMDENVRVGHDAGSATSCSVGALSAGSLFQFMVAGAALEDEALELDAALETLGRVSLETLGVVGLNWGVVLELASPATYPYPAGPAEGALYTLVFPL